MITKALIKSFLNRILVMVTILYAAGICAARFWLEDPLPGLIIFSLLVFFLVITIYYRFLDYYRCLLYFLVFCSGAASFYLTGQVHSDSILRFADTTVYIEGVVAEEPLFFADYASYRLRVTAVEDKGIRKPAGGEILVRVYGKGGDVHLFGEALRMRGQPRAPSKQRNPGGYDHRSHMTSRGIDATINLTPQAVQNLGQGEGFSFAQPAIGLRMAMTAFIGQTLPEPSSLLLGAMLFGKSTLLPEEVVQNFRQSGTGHLMAVSGLHVGLVSLLFLGFCRLMGLRGSLPIIAAVIVVFAYAFLTGMRPSALRAALMIAMALGALYLERENDLPTAVALAALTTLLINPHLLFAPGFQLSYAATLAIIYGREPLTAALVHLRCPPLLQGPLALTLAAQLGVMPLCLYYFHHLPLGAVFFNLLLLPLTGLVVGLGLTGALSGLIVPAVGALLLWASRPLLEIMLRVTALASRPGLYLFLTPPTLHTVVFIYILAVVSLLCYYQRQLLKELLEQVQLTSLFKRWRVLIIFALILVTVLLSPGLFRSSTDDHLVVTFIDVGQGASAFLEAPCGTVVLIDAGGELPFRGEPGDIGSRVVLPFLRSRGHHSLDLAVITHPHEDHFGGFVTLVEKMSIDKMLISPVEEGPPSYQAMLETAAGAGTMIYETSAGDNWILPGGIELAVLGPPPALLQGTGSELNDNSVVVMLTYEAIRMLFTGDIEDAAVTSLLRSGEELRAQVLLVPHHGGYLAKMPKLLEAVKPDLAVIQVGPNPFGHPHPLVIDALAGVGVPTYRNDQHGAIIVTTDGHTLSVETMLDSPCLLQ